GSEPPPPAAAEARPAPGGGRGGRAADPRAPEEHPARTAEGRAPVGLDALWARAERQVPGWVLISQRVSARPDGPVIFVIQEPTGWHPTPPSQHTPPSDPTPPEIVRWEPCADQSLGRRLRSWVRPLHTGEAGGAAGQAVALV